MSGEATTEVSTEVAVDGLSAEKQCLTKVLLEVVDKYHPHGLSTEQQELFTLTKGGLEQRVEGNDLGSSGSYLIGGEGKNYVAIFKPVDEEVGCPNNPHNKFGLSKVDLGFVLGAGFNRELAAYVLDQELGKNASAGVLTTLIVRCYHENFRNIAGSRIPKVGSLQSFVVNDGDLREVEKKNGTFQPEVDNIQKLSILDIRLGNLDRHHANLLVCDRRLIPIDHGCCLPENFIKMYVSWYTYQEATNQPYSKVMLKAIEELDAMRDIATLSSCGINLSFLSTLGFHACTHVLKEGAKKMFTPYKLGYFMATGMEREASSFSMMMIEIYEMLKVEKVDTMNEVAMGIVRKVANEWLSTFEAKNLEGVNISEGYENFLVEKRGRHEQTIISMYKSYYSPSPSASDSDGGGGGDDDDGGDYD